MEEAAVLSVFIERAARMQLLARAVGATFHYYARRTLRKNTEALE